MNACTTSSCPLAMWPSSIPPTAACHSICGSSAAIAVSASPATNASQDLRTTSTFCSDIAHAVSRRAAAAAPPVLGLSATDDLEARTRLEAVSDEGTPTPVEELDDELATESSEPEGIDEEALERRSAALSQVVKFGDPVLKSTASPVTVFDGELEAEAERMIGLMRDAIGVGLAATQLGTLRRMLVFQVGSEAEPTVLINPEIEWRSEEETATAEEGCLSLPGVIVDVERPLHVRARGVDVHGEPFSLEASGLEARVIQHEVDRLDGVLMIDRTERDQRKGALKALREGGTYAPEGDEESEAGDGDGTQSGEA